MDDKIREAIGLLRHQIISPALMESGRGQMDYFRKTSSQYFDVPGIGKKRFSAFAMKGWLKRYRKHGFAGLTPAVRSDRGGHRFTLEIQSAIKKLREENLDFSVTKFHSRCSKASILGDPPLSLSTLNRFLKKEELFVSKVHKARKKYEMSLFGELWVGDFMHGPKVFANATSKQMRKAILFAIIDDYSRMIVGSGFSQQETTLPVEYIFKEALTKFGIPDRIYLDNGPAFSSQYLSRVCANLEIGLVHSKPYDSPSRGKIERFFRTVRESFLVEFKAEKRLELKELNDRWEIWLRDEYHNKIHGGIDSRPLDRYQTSLGYRPRKRIDENILAEFFLVSRSRFVRNDATLSFNGSAFEVPSEFIGRRVELRFTQDAPNDIYLYDKGLRVQKIKVVDAKANGKLYRPGPREAVIEFQKLTRKDEKND
jgi:transposase InsO family protein